MAVAVPQATEARPVTRAERKLAWLLRLFALLCIGGAVVFLVRPDETVRDIDRVGALVRLPTLAQTGYPVVSDFWLAQAVANMIALAACAWLAASDVRRRRALVYPIIVSNLVSSATGILLFVRWSAALPFLAIALIDLPIAVILIAALRAVPAERA
jgi:hypothetical protein